VHRFEGQLIAGGCSRAGGGRQVGEDAGLRCPAFPGISGEPVEAVLGGLVGFGDDGTSRRWWRPPRFSRC
jgi:hypothetical protein